MTRGKRLHLAWRVMLLTIVMVLAGGLAPASLLAQGVAPRELGEMPTTGGLRPGPVGELPGSVRAGVIPVALRIEAVDIDAPVEQQQPPQQVEGGRAFLVNDRLLGSRDSNRIDIDIVLGTKQRQHPPVRGIFGSQGGSRLVGAQGTDQVAQLGIAFSNGDLPGRVFLIEPRRRLELDQRIAEVPGPLEMQAAQAAHRR